MIRYTFTFKVVNKMKNSGVKRAASVNTSLNSVMIVVYLQMLALSVVNAMVTIDKRGNWQTFLSSKGYLRHFATSIVQEDQSLQTSLQPTPEPLRALYIYESRMVSE